MVAVQHTLCTWLVSLTVAATVVNAAALARVEGLLRVAPGVGTFVAEARQGAADTLFREVSSGSLEVALECARQAMRKAAPVRARMAGSSRVQQGTTLRSRASPKDATPAVFFLWRKLSPRSDAEDPFFG